MRCSSSRLTTPAAPFPLWPRSLLTRDRQPVGELGDGGARFENLRRGLRHRRRGLGDGGLALECDRFAAQVRRRTLRQIRGIGDVVRRTLKHGKGKPPRQPARPRVRMSRIDRAGDTILLRHIEKRDGFQCAQHGIKGLAGRYCGLSLDQVGPLMSSGNGTMVDFTVFIAMASATARAIPSSEKGYSVCISNQGYLTLPR